MKILAIGDIIGKPGRKAVKELLPLLKTEHGIDFVVANGENAAGGIGLTPETARELFEVGVDVITSGNHIWAQPEITPMLESPSVPVIRPLNYPPEVPGKGYTSVRGITVVNAMGRVFIGNFDCPFRGMDALLAGLDGRPRIIILDFHAEATSEKKAMGYYLDGRVTAVVGTHTHVGTTDSQILPGGTAYVSDIGMVGPIDSVIGDAKEDVIRRFMTSIQSRLTVAKGRVEFNAVLITADERTGKASKIERIYREAD